MKTLFLCFLLLASAAAQTPWPEPTHTIQITRGGTAVAVMGWSSRGTSSDPVVPQAVSGLPYGITASFSPSSISSTANPGGTVVTLTAPSSFIPYSITPIILGGTTSSHGPVADVRANLFIIGDPSQPTVVAQSTTTALSVAQGTSATFPLSYVTANATGNTFTPGTTTLPVGVSVSFSPATLPAAGGTTTATVTVAGSATAGTYGLTFIAGASPGTPAGHGASVNLTITSP